MSLLEEKFKVAVLRFNGNLLVLGGIFAFIVGLIWLFFPFAVINFFSKQRGSLAEILSGYFVRPRRFIAITSD
jgi:hypothetical protein